MKVCEHGCDVKDVLLFVRLSCKHEFEKVFELKIQQAYAIYPFPSQLKHGVSIFFTEADILSEKNLYFG